MRHTKLLSATALFLPVLASAQQVPPQVIISFDALNMSVPLGAWLPALCAVLMVGVALLWRKRMGPALRSLVLVSSAVLAAATVVHVRDANAGSSTFPIALAASPTTTEITANIGVATNATGRNIQITSVLVAQASGQSSQSCTLVIVPATTTCNPATTLAPGATCQVEVQCPF